MSGGISFISSECTKKVLAPLQSSVISTVFSYNQKKEVAGGQIQTIGRILYLIES
jgi:hypothetical protein